MKFGLLALLVMIFAVNYYITAQTERNPVNWVDVSIGTSNSRWMLARFTNGPGTK